MCLDDPIDRKGEILFFEFLFLVQSGYNMPNHFTGETVYDVLPQAEADLVKDRAVVCKRLTHQKWEYTCKEAIGWDQDERL